MDDYTWQQMIQQRRRRSRLFLVLAALALACALASAIWYFALYRRSPEYALHEAARAVEARDAEAFARYVNLGVITARAYDDLTYDLFAYDATLTEQSKVMFEKFYVLIKPQMTEGTEALIESYIASGEWALPDGTDILKGRQLGIDYERFIERSMLRTTRLESIGEIRREGTGAVARLNVREDRTGAAFTLELSMEQGEDGRWQIAYIRNYRAYLDTVSPVINRDVAAYIDATKDIVETYNKTLDLCRERFVATTRTTDGSLTDGQRAAIANMLENEVIPALKARQKALDEVEVPKGAAYLAKQRKDSTETTIERWQHYIRAMRTGDDAEYAKAEALQKKELAIDLRIEDIIHHTAVSKNIPNLP